MRQNNIHKLNNLSLFKYIESELP